MASAPNQAVNGQLPPAFKSPYTLVTQTGTHDDLLAVVATLVGKSLLDVTSTAVTLAVKQVASLGFDGCIDTGKEAVAILRVNDGVDQIRGARELLRFTVAKLLEVGRRDIVDGVICCKLNDAIRGVFSNQSEFFFAFQ